MTVKTHGNFFTRNLVVPSSGPARRWRGARARADNQLIGQRRVRPLRSPGRARGARGQVGRRARHLFDGRRPCGQDVDPYGILRTVRAGGPANTFAPNKESSVHVCRSLSRPSPPQTLPRR